MASAEIHPISRPAKVNVTGYVDAKIAEFVAADAKSAVRSESFIVGKILQKHYAPRLRSRSQKLVA